MTIDVSACIAELLYEHDSVIIPDFGGIVGVYQEAQIDHVQGVLHPPSTVLRFNENLVINDGVLISYIRNKYRLTLEEAREVVKTHVEGLNKKLSQKEILIFPKVGRLYRDYEDELRFLQDNTNYNTNAFGLPDIQFFPILRDKATALREAPVPSASTPTPTFNNRPKWLTTLANQELVPIAAGFLILIIAVSILFSSQQSNLQSDYQAKPVADRIYNQKPVKERASILEDLIAPKQEEVQKVVPKKKKEVAIETIDEEYETELDTEASTLAPQERVCIVITGAFGKKSSIQKRLNQIIDLGFAPYQDKKGKLTRVGIQFAYETEADIERNMKILHRKIEKKAWIMEK